MNIVDPLNQTKLFGLDKFITELINLYSKNDLPNKILLSGQKGLGKSTLAYHFINYVLSKDEEFSYDLNKFQIDTKNHYFKTALNNSNPNLILIDINTEKKFIDINQVRELISDLNKSSFNNKPRFILIDNIEFLNINSVNALLKILEEPSLNAYFILINNNKNIPSTLKSRCINFKISLTNHEIMNISNKLLDNELNNVVSKELINYYFTPGNIYKLVMFGQSNNFDLSDFNLKEFIKTIIKDNYYKKDDFIKSVIFEFIEFYFIKFNFSISSAIHEQYSYFLKRISDTKKFNLDEESLFMEFEEKILNG